MASKKLPVIGTPREVEPNGALLQEIYRTAGHVDALAAIVAAIPKDDLVEGVTKRVLDPEGGETVTTETAPNIWLRLYREERRHLLDVCRAAAACGVVMAAPEEEPDGIDDIGAQRAKRLARLSGAAS